MIIERIKDELTKETWDFTLIRDTLFLNGYELLKRESRKKRKYTAVQRYDRIQRRNSNIEESQVPFTNEIKKEALRTYFETIDVRRWSER
jgi:hypothetical protein